MDENKKLFRAIGEIPEEYVDDAMNDRVIKEKRIRWKSIAAAAAVFAAVAAVPAGIRTAQNKADNQNTVPAQTSFISETQGCTDAGTENSNEEPEKNAEPEKQIKSTGTGPEKPEGYLPDLTYSYVSFYGDSAGFNIYETERILTAAISSEEFAYRIKADIEKTVNECFSKIDSELSEKEREELNSYIEEMKSVDDGHHDDDIVWKNYACEFTGIVNGYLSVLINVNYGTKSTAFYRVYDIINEKIIENESDMFFRGTDYISLIEESEGYICDDDDEKFNQNVPVMSVGAAAYLLGTDSSWMPRSLDYSLQMTLVLPEIISGKYRDVSGYVPDGLAKDLQWNSEWYSHRDRIDIDGEEISVFLSDSVFHSEEEIRRYNEENIELYKKVYRKFADKHIESVLSYFRTNGIWLDYYDYNSLVNVYYFVCEGNMPAERYIIDADTAEIITEEELFGDWRSCISKVYRDIESDDEIRRETVPEDDFSAFSNYTLKTWYWDNARFVPENDRDYAPKGYSEFLSDDEISTLDSIAYVFVLEDKETGDEVYASALIPFDRIPERYFDRETYLDNVRHWAR